MHYFREVRRINIHAYGDLPAATRCNLKKNRRTIRCFDVSMSGNKAEFFGSMLHPLILKKTEH